MAFAERCNNVTDTDKIGDANDGRAETDGFATLKELEGLVQQWRVRAQTVGYDASRYYNEKRVEGYNRKLTCKSRYANSDGEVGDVIVSNSAASCSAEGSGGGSQAAIARSCVNMLPFPRYVDGGLVLDIGCGSGLSSVPLHRRKAGTDDDGIESDKWNSFVLGIDAAPAMLRS